MRILIVDDELNIRKTLRVALESMRHTVEEAAGAADAVTAIERQRFDLALVDLRLGGESGLDLLDGILRRSPRTAVVIITAHGTIDTAVEAMRRGAFDYLPKPFTPAQVRAVLERVERFRDLQNRVDDLEEHLAVEIPEISMDSDDPQVRAVLEQGRRVADTDAVVLIRGESGTGKGVFARAIHAWSRRSRAPFVTVSCPSLSAELLESALFGHARGAFTGAVTDTEGKVAAAEGGTLFLDEIGDLPLDAPAQAAPLPPGASVRAGRRGPAPHGRRPAGRGDQPRPRRRRRRRAVPRGPALPPQRRRAGMPPLRERSDRLALAEHLLAFFARQMGKRIEGFTPEAREALFRYAWPGNLRELRNAMERAAIFAAGREVDAADLPGRIIAGASRPAAAACRDDRRRRAGDPRASSRPSTSG